MGPGGWNCAAHLHRGDLRYQRKEARIVRRADHAVVPATAVGGHGCAFLQLAAALVHAVAGLPAGPAGQPPSVVLPVGAEFGVDLVPVVLREHGEPAGVAVPVLPSVAPIAILIFKHAAAVDTDAVVGGPIPYDLRHAMFVSPISVPRHRTNGVVGDLAGFDAGARAGVGRSPPLGTPLDGTMAARGQASRASANASSSESTVEYGRQA